MTGVEKRASGFPQVAKQLRRG
jgi:hypothetical protein